MRKNKVIFLSIVFTLVLSIVGYLIFQTINIPIGMCLGTLSGILAMYILVSKFNNIDLTDYKYLNKSMKGNRILRFVIYIISILFGVIFPSIFHVLTIFFIKKSYVELQSYYHNFKLKLRT